MPVAETVFDPWAPDVQADPYPHYARLRERTPVCRIAADDAWVVTRYGDVRTVTSDHRRFSVREGLGVRRDHMGGNLLVMRDPPLHTRSRRALQPPFLPKNLSAWRSRAQSLADDLVDAMLADGGRVEFKEAVAMPLVTQMVIEMLGLPDAPELVVLYPYWSKRVMEDLDRRYGDPDIEPLHATLQQAIDFFSTLVADRRASPDREPQDLTDMIIATTDVGHTEFEVAQVTMTVLAAGLANTADMMCHGVKALCENPGQWELLRSDPDRRAVQVVEESIRFGSPAHCVYRLALEDAELSGTTIPKGSRIMVLWGSANHDETVFEDPDRFDIVRENHGRHLGWGVGVHRCIGEHIARLEGIAIFRALARRLRTISLDGTWMPYATSAVRGFDQLPIAVAD